MYPDLKSNSAALWESAKAFMPGGSTRHTVFFPPYPVYAEKGEGFRIWDVDGVERIDCVNNYSSLIHGHSHPKILDVVGQQIAKVISVGLPTHSEIKLAALLCNRIESVDLIRFTNSGTEATMLALKVARAFTQRPMIAKAEGAFHGSGDDVEVSLAPTPNQWGEEKAPSGSGHCRGVPRTIVENTLVLPLNDLEASRTLIRAHTGELAAVLIDPLVSRLGFVRVSDDYLAMLREETASAGILLVFDEVFSFRLGFSGAQGERGITPDITTLGKIIGGGFPVGAVGGRRDVMSVLDQTNGPPPVAYGGTFNANPVTMAAGLAAMELLTPDEYERLKSLGERLREGLRKTIADRRIAAQVKGAASLVSLILSDKKIDNYRDMARAGVDGKAVKALHRGLLNRGVLMVLQGGFILSTPMTFDEVDLIIATVDETLAEVVAA